jgi:hypothetical protein
MEIFEHDSCAAQKLSWIERADRVGQVWGSSPHEPTTPDLIMAFLYILQSDTTERFYVGSTPALERRLSEHLRGHC